MIDTEPVEFLNFSPASDKISNVENIDIELTIFDLTSGVNTSSMFYSTSFDTGKTWSDWKLITNFEKIDRFNIRIDLDLIFPDGIDNRIRFRAMDVAGNGPIESMIYSINVNLPQEIPKIRLVAPINNSIINTSEILLKWELVNENISQADYFVYIDTNDPPGMGNFSIIQINEYKITNLLNGTTYFWQVIPEVSGLSGLCLDGIWSFSVQIFEDYKQNQTNITDKNETHKIKIICPGSIILEQGETRELEFSIENLGNTDKTIAIELNANNVPGSVNLKDKSNLRLTRNSTFINKLIISITNAAEPGDYNISIIVRFENNDQYISVEHELKIKIIEKSQKNDGSDQYLISEQNLIFIILVMIILIVLIFIFIIRSKRLKEQFRKEFQEKSADSDGIYTVRSENQASFVSSPDSKPVITTVKTFDNLKTPTTKGKPAGLDLKPKPLSTPVLPKLPPAKGDEKDIDKSQIKPVVQTPQIIHQIDKGVWRPGVTSQDEVKIDKTEQLKKLIDLKTQGKLTDAEFFKLKNELLK